ncbi:AAA family ATPase [Streptomyces actuosus]|uniref:AAA family ATPase n=1 Tax=Streptomyces actuosus TaxID=1885 RepID=A0ABS2VHF4_STRAS|nr:AAA family ATPase [Streptomyces actuosus]MBN0042532.1 AAA family ATPase [Streptomyces actuosus]
MGKAEPTPRRVFADRLSELLGLAADLPIKSAVAEVNRRRPAGRSRPISGRRVSDWKQGRHLPESEMAFLLLVRVLLNHCRGRQIPAALLDEEQWRRCLRAARASPPDPEPPAQQSPAQVQQAGQAAHDQRRREPDRSASAVPDRHRGERPVHPREDFIGRMTELAALAERIEAAATGAGSVVLLAGPAGIGKSTLAAEALRRHADSARFTVVRGHCPRDAVAPPLWPWQRALRLAGVTPGGAAQRTAAPRPGAGAAPGHRPWEATDPATAATARFMELAGIGEALAVASSQRPLIVLLEDLHWADTASLDLLLQVKTGVAAECRLLVLGTFREPVPEEAAGALGSLGCYWPDVLRLAPFTREEVAQCVGEPNAADSYRRTGGLPLLVTALRTHGADLSTIVSGLLTGLTAEQRSVMRAAAVLDERVDATDLAAVLPDLDETLVAQALAAAWHAGVLNTAETTGAGRTYRFTHDLVRDEILGRTDPAVARALHRAAALALEQAEGAGAAARIAAHWRLAGRGPGHRAAAAHWSRIAADQARDRLAYTDAARYLADAAAVLGPTDPQRAPALIELARAEYLAGRYDASLRHCTEAADAANATGQPALLAEVALVLQGVTFPRASQTISRLCRAALAVEGLSGAVRARLLAQLASASADLGSPGMAAEHARAALDLAEATGDLRAELDAARAREMTLAHPDDTAERLSLGELSVSRAEQLGDPLAAVLGHEWRIQAGYLLGRLNLVTDAISGIKAITARSALPLTRWHLLRVTASQAVQVGEFAAARRYNEEAAELALASGDQTAIAMNHVLCQQLALVRGAPEELPEEMWRDLDRAPREPLILSVRARALFLARRLDEAREAYTGLRALLPIPMTHPTWPGVLLHLVDLIEMIGDAEAARLVFDQLALFRPYPGALGTPTAYFSGTVSRELGRLALVAGRPAEAETLLREALVRNHDLGARPYVALTCLNLATVQRDQGALAEAAALAGETLAIADQLDQPGPSADAMRLLDEIAALHVDPTPITPLPATAPHAPSSRRHPSPTSGSRDRPLRLGTPHHPCNPIPGLPDTPRRPDHALRRVRTDEGAPGSVRAKKPRAPTPATGPSPAAHL